MNDLPNEPTNENTPPPQLDWFSRFLVWLSGANAKVLVTQCPEDISKVLAQAGLLIGTFIYSSVVLTLISNHLFAAGHFSFGLMLGAIGVSALVAACDAYVFLHCSWLKDGVAELKKCLWDIPLPTSQRVRMNLFLGNRVFLALGWAQIIGVCLGLILFESDVTARIDANYLKGNANVVAEVSRPYDAEIKSERELVGIQEGVVKALARQATTLRQNEVNWIVRGSRKRRADPATDGRIQPFEAKHDEEQTKLDAMKRHLADLVQGRNAAIRKAVDSAPNHVPYSDGFLAQVRALDEIAGENGRVAFLIIVLELVAVGIELAPILAKVLGLNPTAYSAIHAREYYLRLTRIADELERELDKDVPTPPEPPTEKPMNDNLFFAGIDTPANDNIAPELPVKRKRGRPRKVRSASTNGSGQGLPEV
jgi:hypothetical protein